VAALLALALALIALVLVIFGGGGGHSYRMLFQNAGQLVNGDDVQVGGRRIGSIDSIDLTADNQALVKVTLDEFAPLHAGTTAVIRATSLSGVANRYIALTPGPNNRPKLADNATIPTERTTSIVDLDQLFNTLDAPTRRSLQEVVQGSATQYEKRQRLANLSLRYLNPALGSAARVVGELTRDQNAFTGLVVNTSRVVTALAARRADLSALIGNAQKTAGAIASQNASFDQALAVLPGTLQQANTTFADLRPALDDLDVLVAASKPATRRLAPFLAQLRPLVADAVPTVHDLRTLVFQAGPNNDLVDLLLKLPAFERRGRPVFSRAVSTLEKSQPVLEFIRPYGPELLGWIRDFGQGASTYDANGHYARIMPIFNEFQFTDNPAGGLLQPVSQALRLAGYDALAHGTGNFTRCPGTATQTPGPRDNSAPFTDSGRLDCNPAQVLPGSSSSP
jgi:phospholipid/cholesterol/gamma-HCH transport system substrate-binding protein